MFDYHRLVGTWRLVQLDRLVPGTIDVPIKDTIDRSCFGLTSLQRTIWGFPPMLPYLCWTASAEEASAGPWRGQSVWDKCHTGVWPDGDFSQVNMLWWIVGFNKLCDVFFPLIWEMHFKRTCVVCWVSKSCHERANLPAYTSIIPKGPLWKDSRLHTDWTQDADKYQPERCAINHE